MATTILIGDQVVATTGSGHPYEGKTGVVRASRLEPASGEISHQVEFPRRLYTEEEMDRGEDKDPVENIVWFRASEVEKVEG